MLQPGEVEDSLHAYRLANDEFTGPRGAGYRRMIDLSPAARAGTPDEVGNVGALPMGPDGAFITGSMAHRPRPRRPLWRSPR